MFQVTGRAAAELRRVLAGLDAREAAYLRLRVTEQGMGVILDQQRSGDQAIRDGDDVLLLVDETTASRLSNRTMDFDESNEQLVFT